MITKTGIRKILIPIRLADLNAPSCLRSSAGKEILARKFQSRSEVRTNDHEPADSLMRLSTHGSPPTIPLGQILDDAKQGINIELTDFLFSMGNNLCGSTSLQVLRAGQALASLGDRRAATIFRQIIASTMLYESGRGSTGVPTEHGQKAALELIKVLKIGPYAIDNLYHLSLPNSWHNVLRRVEHELRLLGAINKADAVKAAIRDNRQCAELSRYNARHPHPDEGIGMDGHWHYRPT